MIVGTKSVMVGTFFLTSSQYFSVRPHDFNLLGKQKWLWRWVKQMCLKLACSKHKKDVNRYGWDICVLVAKDSD